MNLEGHHMMNAFHPNNVASTSSNSFHDLLPQHNNQPFFSNNAPQHQHPHPQPAYPSQSMHHRHPHNDWQEHAMQMNAPQMNASHMNGPPPNPVPSQQQAPFNQPSWGAQANPQQSFFNMPANPMNPAFNMPFLPQQIIQEAYAMSIPVEGSDEPILLTKLLNAARHKESYKDALNSLHGRNGHSASLWKDYYLDNKDRLDAWIAMCLQKEQDTGRSSAAAGGSQRSLPPEIERVKSTLPTVKKPSPASFKREPSPHPLPSRASISAPSAKRAQKKSTPQSAHSTPPLKDAPQGSRRSTINSLTAPSPVYGDRLPPPNAEIKIPDPPSRSPSPPSNVIPHRGRGNKYTKEDREFFIKFIGWRLKQDPSLTRLDLCNMLAEKAPHHTAQSWASHWSNNHDVPDKILAAARGDDYEAEAESSPSEKARPSRPRPKYKDPTTTEESEGEESDEEDDGEESEEEANNKPIRVYSEKEMGQKGEPFTDADLYITAKHIATFPSWHAASHKERWDSYSQKFPQRSAKAWAEYYRRNELALSKLVKRIQKESKSGNASTSSIKAQCARPTRVPSKMKRKLEPDSGDESLVKRGRAT